jgi:hypothetical protein
MQAHQSSDGTPRKKKTPADRAAEFAAVQVQLKHEAAARRAARPAEVKSTKHVARGRQRSGR